MRGWWVVEVCRNGRTWTRLKFGPEKASLREASRLAKATRQFHDKYPIRVRNLDSNSWMMIT